MAAAAAKVAQDTAAKVSMPCDAGAPARGRHAIRGAHTARGCR